MVAISWMDAIMMHENLDHRGTSMEQDQQSLHALLHRLLDFGEMMLRCGAEIHRVEDTLTRMGQAYGAVRTDIFVITSSIVVTIAFPDGVELTQTRRIVSIGPTDFFRMERLNALSRRCCKERLSQAELGRALEQLEKPIPTWWLYLGSFLGAGSFAVFFGGNLLDGFAAALFGLVICFCQQRLAPLCPNAVIFNLFCSFFIGLGLSGLGAVFPLLHVDQIMIGDIMLLIPGLAMTNSIRDVLVGDTISGVMRLTESLLWAGALACGFMASIWLIGG